MQRKQLSEDEVKAEILDASPELIKAILRRLTFPNDHKLIWELVDILEQKTGTLPVFNTSVEYRLERFHEYMEGDHDPATFPPLPDDEMTYNALLSVAQNFEVDVHEYEHLDDKMTDACMELHKQRFPQYWAKHEAKEVTEDGNEQGEAA
jgi:hypothetical protein